MKKRFLFVALTLVSSIIYATSYYIGAKAEHSWQIVSDPNDPRYGQPWKPDVATTDVCSYWYSTMSNNNDVVQKSYTTLRNLAITRYETNGDQHTTYGLDGMDIFLHCGHSGLTDTNTSTGISANSRWNMWEVDTKARSSNMRLGDEARELKLFSTYGCYQMNNDDGHIWQRWIPIFGGGLKYATGFHHRAFVNALGAQKNKDVGIDYANYLNTTNKTIKYAWWDAVKTFANNTPQVTVTGTDRDNSISRRDNMRMVDLPNYTVLRDSDIGYMNWTAWRTNLDGGSKDYQQIQQKSDSFRIDKDFVNLMVARKGAGKEFIADKLISKFTNGDTITMKTDENSETVIKDNFMSVTGNGWDLAISNDGTKVNYRNSKYLQENKSQYGRNMEMSANELEIYGRDFIENDLKDFIHLGRNEELVFIQSKYEIDGIIAADETLADETVVANIAYFGRKKDDLMFVGYGSLIIVEFSNDRKPISFYYNWVDFDELDEIIPIASKEEIDYRISALSDLNYGYNSVKNIDVKTVCGLYYNNNTYLQPACEIQQSAELKDGDYVGIINHIPVGKVFFDDESWYELTKLNDFGEVCKSTDITPFIFNENDSFNNK